MKTMKMVMMALVLTLFAVVAVGAAGAAEGQGKPQTTCPVLGGKVDKQVYVDYKGQRIYFCCKGCDAEFRKDPEKYLKKMEEQGVTPEKTPAGKEGK
jgi:YHS domain-containing protein